MSSVSSRIREYLPRIDSYGEYASENYGQHTRQLSIGPITLYYSYSTLVAFRAPGCGLVVHQNDWGKTTGKHLNWIDGGREDPEQRRRRVNDDAFEQLLVSHVIDQLRLRKEVEDLWAEAAISDGAVAEVKQLVRTIIRKTQQEEACAST